MSFFSFSVPNFVSSLFSLDFYLFGCLSCFSQPYFGFGYSLVSFFFPYFYHPSFRLQSFFTSFRSFSLFRPSVFRLLSDLNVNCSVVYCHGFYFCRFYLFLSPSFGLHPLFHFTSFIFCFVLPSKLPFFYSRIFVSVLHYFNKYTIRKA